MNPLTIQETERVWKEEPEKAKLKSTLTARSDGSQAVLECGPFSWRCDLPLPLGGNNTAPPPTALLLGALAGCAVVFIRDTIAPQLGVRVEAVQAVAECETDGRGLLGIGGAVSDFQNVQITVQIHSSDTPENVQKLYETWQQRCSIYSALTKPMSIKTSLEIKGI
jgi:uncharacterized OsmC-like protein